MNIKRSLKRKTAYGTIKYRKSDVFLVSYPKSGNSWLRFLIANYLTGNKCNWDNSHHIVPDIHFNPEKCVDLPDPRFIKSHFPYDKKSKTHKYPKVVYLMRDGRDVAVSYFFHLKKVGILPQDISFENYIQLFNSGKLDDYSTWSKHVEGWTEGRNKNILIIKYDEMKKDPINILEKVLVFGGVDVDKNKLIQAVDASSFQNMKKLENESTFTWLNDKLGKDVKKSETQFVRQGISGSWVDMFTQKTSEEFMKVHKSQMKQFSD